MRFPLAARNVWNRRYPAVGGRCGEGLLSTRWSHSRSVKTIDRPRSRANGSSRPMAAVRLPHSIRSSVDVQHGAIPGSGSVMGRGTIGSSGSHADPPMTPMVSAVAALLAE
jgi:hypothetical protein